MTEQAQNTQNGDGTTRREFVVLVGVGLLVAVLPESDALAQARRRGGGAPVIVSARIHISKEGAITVMVGKVEAGQGARAELTQAAAEELHVSADKISLIMADTALVPDDGITAGSGTTPRTVPAVRQGAAAAREILALAAAKLWGVDAATLTVRDGKVLDEKGKREVTFGELVAADEKVLSAAAPNNISVTAVKDWKVMGTPVVRPNNHDIVTGAHHFPSDIQRPGMLYGKVFRAPRYGAKPTLNADFEALPGVHLVHDGDFVGIVATNNHRAQIAIEGLAKIATWSGGENFSSDNLYESLAEKAKEKPANPFADTVKSAAKSLKATYHVAYAQHAPLEPRAAVADWSDGKLTVWTGTQNPFGVRGELMKAFNLPEESVRVIVPDFGGGFGGKHSGECAVEAARLAKNAGKPVSLRWTRAEEFTWAYFRPAAVIDIEASLDDKGSLTSWHYININSGPSGLECPYKIDKNKSQFINSSAPLRQGSYRALASTANNFARESFIDELANAAGADPLEFRLAHLEKGRLRDVLEDAAARFEWTKRVNEKRNNVGVGLSCGTEKGSYAAACVEVEIVNGQILVRRVVQSFECGKIVNPGNLMSQVQGAIVMGLGPALREGMTFANGMITNASFMQYKVPRFVDLPKLDVKLLDRPDLASVGAGETPIIAVAPAIANAVFAATGKRLRAMPLTL